jgi:hypothetical protein
MSDSLARWTRRSLFLLALILTITSARRSPAQDVQGPSTKEQERLKLEEMKQVVRRFRMEVIDDRRQPSPATPAAEPLHRWTDPTRPFSGGALWAWRSSGRPVAIIAIELYDSWALEFVSLSAGPLRADDGAISWTPAGAGVVFRDIPDSPAAAIDEAGRLRQMRELARAFSASEFWEERHHALRLMPHPIDRYADSGSGLVDGAIFAYANGTNPEVLLMIEARRQGDRPSSWVYAAAPLSKAASTLKIGTREVWTSPAKDESTLRPEDTYYIKLTPRRRAGS